MAGFFSPGALAKFGDVALMMKPIVEARARERQQGGQGGVLLPLNSAEATPIETREVVADMAGVSRDTVRKVEAIRRTRRQKSALVGRR